VIWLEEAALAVRPVGVLGAILSRRVVAVAVLEEYAVTLPEL
jgi:hypothetical protein